MTETSSPSGSAGVMPKDDTIIHRATRSCSFALPNQGCLVRIDGLTSTVGQKLNGSLAQVCGWDGKVKRYTIKVINEKDDDESSSSSKTKTKESNKPIQVQPKNLLYFEKNSSSMKAQKNQSSSSKSTCTTTTTTINKDNGTSHGSKTTRPIHVLLSARLEDEDSVFRAKQCIRSIESQTIIHNTQAGGEDDDCNKPNDEAAHPPPFSVVVCSWCAITGGDRAEANSSTLLQMKLQALLRQNAITSKLRWYYFPSSPVSRNHSSSGNNNNNNTGYGDNYLSEMEQLKQIFQVSSDQLNPNAWLMPFRADDIMFKARVQRLDDYIEKKILAGHEESLKLLPQFFFVGKLVTTRHDSSSFSSIHHHEYTTNNTKNPDGDYKRWLATMIQSATYFTPMESMQTNRIEYSDFCMHTSLFNNFFQATPDELLAHPFAAQRFYRYTSARAPLKDGVENYYSPSSSSSSWHVIQFERPNTVDDEYLASNFGSFLDPDTIQDTLPYYYRLAQTLVSEEDEMLANKYNRLSRYTVAIFRLLLEGVGFSRTDWMAPVLKLEFKSSVESFDRYHGEGFGEELVEQVIAKWNPLMRSLTREVKTLLNPEALHFAKRNVLHPEYVGIKDVHSVRFRYGCAGHCPTFDIPDRQYGVHECRVSRSQYRPYQGIDTNVTDQKRCHMCHRPEGLSSKMLRCTRCNMIYYCSRECQKEDFPSHKERCKYINKLKIDICNEEKAIKDDPSGVGTETNPFEIDVENFDRNVRLIPHLFKRAELGKELYNMAKIEDCVHPWQETLYYILELIRLDRPNSLGSMTRYMVPSVLLYLNRDDDCFSFIKYFMMMNHIADDNINIPKSKPGDWIFEKRPGCRFEDITPVAHDGRNYHQLDLTFAVTFVVLKLRVIAHTRARKSSMATFRETWAGKKLEPALPVVEEFLVGTVEFRQEQQAQADKFVGIVELSNPHIWPAFLDPDTVNEYYDATYSIEALDEDPKMLAHAAMSYLLVPFLRIPDARELLLHFLEVGETSEMSNLWI